MRVLRKSGALLKSPDSAVSAAERARHYEDILSSVNSYDFDVFPNAKCTEEELYMTVRYGPGSPEFAELQDIESYLIEDPEDIERSVLNFIKCREFDISGEEVDRLVKYAERKMRPQLEAYEMI